MGTAFVGGPQGNTEVEYLWLCEECWAEGDETFLYGSMPTYSARCSRCGKSDPSYCLDPACNEPRPASGGWQMDFTTCVAVTPWPYVVWDVNNYYRELGVQPSATKREIREAYQGLEGQASSRLTFIVKQLLDDEVRRHYNACDLGTTFIDAYVVRWITQQMADDARAERIERRERGEVVEEDEFEKIDLSHLINKPFETVVDRAPDVLQPGRNKSPHAGWGFYRWKTGTTPYERVSRWRGLLCSVASERGERLTLAVGLAGDMASPVEVHRIGYRIVVFLGVDEQPSEALAHEALDRATAIIHAAT